MIHHCVLYLCHDKLCNIVITFQTVSTYALNVLTLVTRSGTTSCSAVSALAAGTGTVTTCCTTDNCNSATIGNSHVLKCLKLKKK